jgi:hypothetical protein
MAPRRRVDGNTVSKQAFRLLEGENGILFLGVRENGLNILSVSPTHFETSAAIFTTLSGLSKSKPVALAASDFPVPGGPQKRAEIPIGAR